MRGKARTTGAGIDIFAKIAPVSVDCDEWPRFGLPVPVGFRRIYSGRSVPAGSHLAVKRARDAATNYRPARCAGIRSAFLELAPPLRHFDRSRSGENRSDTEKVSERIYPAPKGQRVEYLAEEKHLEYTAEPRRKNR